LHKKIINACHIITGDLWAGAESQAYALIVGLSKSRGINLNVITFNHGILVRKLTASGIKVEVISEKSNNFLKMIWAIYTILKSTETEIIHTHGYKETLLGGTAARLYRVKCIVRTHHGKGVMDASLKHQLIEKFNKTFFTDRVISVSEDLKIFLISRGFKENIITVIHNGVNANDVAAIREKSSVRTELNIDDRAIVVGTVGRMVKVKGHKYFIEGAKAILTKEINVVFIIAGDGPLMNEIKKEIKKLGISKQVKLLGFRKDAYDIINLFDIFALTSLHEGIPMVLLEAMFLKKPIIATNVGGIPEILSDRRNSLLIPPMDSGAFSAACLELIENIALRQQIAENAKIDVAAKYQSGQVADKVEKLYRQF
jgi:L-malate glycosyltransferase